MYIIMTWGENVAQVEVEQCRCRDCGYPQPTLVVARYKYFRLWWLFGQVEKANYWTVCRECGYQEDVSPRMAVRAAGRSPIPFLDRHGLWLVIVLIALVFVVAFIIGKLTR